MRAPRNVEGTAECGPGVSRRAVLGTGTALAAGAATSQLGTRAYAGPNGPDQAPPDGDRYVDVQLLSITDLHGYLQPTDVTGYNVVTDRGEQKVVGGAAYLAAHLKRLRAGYRNSIFSPRETTSPVGRSASTPTPTSRRSRCSTPWDSSSAR